MAIGESRNGARGRNGKDAIARGLGWFSLALGAAQVAAPRRFARLIGVRADGEHGLVMRAVGMRELATGVGILARPRPAGWLWARVAGDAIDLALLAKADAKRRNRVAAAMAAVAGVTVPDVVESARLSRANGAGAAEPIVVTKAITVNKPAQEVFRFWRDFENFPRFMAHVESVRATSDTVSHWVAKGPAAKSVAWDAEIVEERPGSLISWRSLPGADVENSGSVRFVPAPGNRGTEIQVELRYSPPGGTIGATLAKLFGEEPATQLADDLRRCKQVLETGEVVVSEGSPRGHAFKQHLKQRPAQPLSEEVAR
jgi:uncharacterized membrane protein